jgi:hypothetical protein
MWYVVTGLVLVVGVMLIVVSRPDSSEAGVQIGEHWHAALGVYDCDTWVSDGTGDGLWQWPYATADQRPSRGDNQSAYAGLHSHADGIIHLEPATSEETGEDATIGKYFEFGNWEVDSTSYNFLGVERKNGDACGDAKGTMAWSLNGVEQTSNPADYVLEDGDVVVIAFLPEGTELSEIGAPPSVANLANAVNTETPPGQMAPITTAPATDTLPADTATTAPAATDTTPTTGAPTATSTP